MSYEIEYCKKYEPIFGSWYIKRKLGEGNFGAVFEIEREDFGTKYHAALKIISIPKNRSELESIMNDTLDEAATERYIKQVVEKIVKEFELMSKLKGNSNIVSYEDHKVIKHENDAGWDILIRMELLTPMLSYVKTNVMTRRDVVKIGIDICRALELCKKQNIIHRDIKPENIFVSESGDYKLGDFGIAKQVEESQTELTKIGTPTYMAPEVVKGHEYDTSVDMYSLGVVLYRFLNHNRAPFMPQYPNPVDFSYKDMAFGERVNGKKPFPTPTNAGSKELSDIIIKACSYSPEDRFSSPEEMRKKLEAVLANETDEILSVPAMSYGTQDAAPSKTPASVPTPKNTPEPTPKVPDSLPEISEEPEEKTELLESQNKYSVPKGESIILDNITDGLVKLSRSDNTPVSTEITRKDGTVQKYDGWTENEIKLLPGEKVLVKNTSERNIYFYCTFGEETAVTKSNNEKALPTKNKKKSKLVPVIVILLVFAALAAGGTVLFCEKLGLFGNKNDNPENNEPAISQPKENIENPVEAEDENIDEPVVNEPQEDETIITDIPEDEKTQTLVTDADRNEKIDRIYSILNASSEMISSINGIADKDVSNFSGILAEMNAVVEEYKNLDYENLEYEELLVIEEMLEVRVASQLESVNAQVSELPTVEICSYCGSNDHTSHPKCSYCGSYDHTSHPKCSYCGSYDHTSHPKCSYCGSYDHTSHPKCSICGSLDHAEHPAILPDL